jgi:hypothetical protein
VIVILVVLILNRDVTTSPYITHNKILTGGQHDFITVDISKTQKRLVEVFFDVTAKQYKPCQMLGKCECSPNLQSQTSI